MATESTSISNPHTHTHIHHLVVNMLRLLARIETSPFALNRNSLQRLREQIDTLHRIKLTVALPDGLDLDSVDRRVVAVMELEQSARLAHQRGENESPPLGLPPRSLDKVVISGMPVAASGISENEEDDMRSALLTPKGAPSRKKVAKFKSDKPIIGGSVSMQILRSESITKMNNQLKNVMQDIKNTATKVREYRIASKSATTHDFFFTIQCHRFSPLIQLHQDNIILSETSNSTSNTTLQQLHSFIY